MSSASLQLNDNYTTSQVIDAKYSRLTN